MVSIWLYIQASGEKQRFRTIRSLENSVTLFSQATALRIGYLFYRNPTSLPPIFTDMPLVGCCCTPYHLFL